MILQICSVFDAAAKAYITPMFFRTRMEAIRGFRDAVQQEGSQFQKHYADYALFVLGTFDDNSAVFAPEQMPLRLISASECLPGDDVFPPSRKVT